MKRNISEIYKTGGKMELRTRIYDVKLIKWISDLWTARSVFYQASALPLCYISINRCSIFLNEKIDWKTH